MILLSSTLLVGGLAAKRTLSAAGNAPDFATIAFEGSEGCVDCHADRHESWYRTYHRTMTQQADADSVQGAFDGSNLAYNGLDVRPVKDSEGWWFEYRDPDTGALLQRIGAKRTVGSNRYQQYLTEDNGTWYRLHYLWHNEDQEWVHLNHAFLHGDDLDFDQMVSVWDHNCIFCHNTGPEPRINNLEQMQARAARGEPVNAANEATYDSRVAELGISCETCHAPGALHVELNQSLWRRWVLQLTGARDASIVNPEHLSSERSAQICGQCHAQRQPKDVATLQTWLRSGPTYRAGMNLNEHVNPVWQFTEPPPGAPADLYSARFWADGTPRLSAYEYQGLLLSECHSQAELGCIDCHSMHGGDPKGMISERNRGNAPCLKCHQEYQPEDALIAHTRHPAEGEASLCYNCHMPYATYGVMTTHRSHRIDIPDPAVSAAAGKPNACSNCHQEQSLLWVAEQIKAGWGTELSLPARRDQAPIQTADGYAHMLSGDAAQRAIAAVEAGKPHDRSFQQRVLMVPALLALLDDRYPSSRRFALHSLRNIAQAWPEGGASGLLQALASYDWQADSATRQPAHASIDEAWRQLAAGLPAPPPSVPLLPNYQPDPARWATLWELGQRQDQQISIGE
jgi:predicted CXXCH cytochrome family protein